MHRNVRRKGEGAFSGHCWSAPREDVLPALAPTWGRVAPQAIVALLAAWSLADPAMAQGESQGAVIFPTTEFADGAKSAAVTVGNVTAGVSQVFRPDIEKNGEIPVLDVIVDGRSVLRVAGVGAGSGYGFVAAEASIAEIDPGNAHPEIYFSSYSGGAHCCNLVIVAEELNGEWIGVGIGKFDGDGYYLEDLDGDGLAEIVTPDNRFLYEFDCYACSAAPLTMTTLRSGTVFDISSDPRFLPAHRDWLEQIEDSVEPGKRWSSMGYLAGWVAAKIRVGEGADAWQQLSEKWDYAGDTGDEVCLTGGKLEDCANKSRAVLKFPERLRFFLEQTGYVY
jgi:hypothetical protein